MNYIAHLLTSKDFAWGVIAAGLLMGILMLYSAKLRIEELLRAHRMEAAIKIGKKFYYIVTEHEWNQVTLARLRDRRENPPTVIHDDGVEPCLMFMSRYGARYYWSDPSFTESASKAKFFPNKSAAQADHDKFRLIYPLDTQCRITIMSISELDTDTLGKARLLELAEEQFAQKKGNQL